ncbi:MAG: amidohydrolase family protein [Spirochaetaceae bacterium]|jgi:guanine deaminase|nr:amidohydrolase family protein [Spirochaetaceae bacterium]
MFSDSFVLRGDICYSGSSATLVTLPDGYLVCREGVSAGVFPRVPEEFRSLPMLDYRGMLVVPGLVDLHTHAPQFRFRGLGMDCGLLEWLSVHAFPEEAKYAELRYAQAAYGQFVAELAKGPNTRSVVFATVHADSALLLMDLLEASGLVCMAGKVNMDRNAPEGLCERDAEASLAETRRWLSGCAERHYKNTYPILTPRFAPSCSAALLRGLGALQAEFNLPLQSHLSENRGEIAFVKELFPATSCYGDVYRQFGLFGENGKTVMAHCVWSDDEEIALMKAGGVFVAHCPQSNTNLASGIAPVRRYLSENLAIGLGSDVAGGAHMSIFRAMQDAIAVSKLRQCLVNDDEKPLTVEEAFYLATKGGGAFFGRVGSFEAGYECDALVIDDAEFTSGIPVAQSISERLERAVYLSDDRHIRAKWARGARIGKSA